MCDHFKLLFKTTVTNNAKQLMTPTTVTDDTSNDGFAKFLLGGHWSIPALLHLPSPLSPARLTLSSGNLPSTYPSLSHIPCPSPKFSKGVRRNTVSSYSGVGLLCNFISKDSLGSHSISVCNTQGAFHWDIRRLAGDQLSTGTQWNAFRRLVGHPLAAEKRRDRKLGCIVMHSDEFLIP